MLNIVTGKTNSGKTTRLLDIYNKSKKGDGFLSIKNMDGHNVHSYDILKLTSQEKKKFVLHENYIDKPIQTSCIIGPYYFLKDTLTYIESEIKEMIQNKVSPIYIDEIGLLELYDKCFHNIFGLLVQSKLEIYAIVREDLIDKVLEKYNITEYKILP